MTYTKQQWADNNVNAPYGPVDAARLAHMEDGIYNASLGVGKLAYLVDTTPHGGSGAPIILGSHLNSVGSHVWAAVGRTVGNPDPVNAMYRLTGIVPASGNLLLALNFTLYDNGNSADGNIGWANHGTVVPVVASSLFVGVTGGGYFRRHFEWIITGLTPGAAFDYDLIAISGSDTPENSQFYIYQGDGKTLFYDDGPTIAYAEAV